MGKGGKAQTIGYKYYLGMHLGMCHGPVDAITRLSVDDRVAWSGTNTGGSINVSAAELFGGEKREGGVSGTIDVAMGGPAQGQNSYLVSKLGSLIPAYRGIVGLIFRQCYLGNNPYLKKWSVRAQRIHKRQTGIAQWYDDKAEINSDPDLFKGPWEYQVLPYHANPGTTNLDIPTTGWDNSANMPFGNSVWSYPSPALSVIWARKTLTGIPTGVVIQVRADNGCVVWVNGQYIGGSNVANADIDNNDRFPVEFTVPSAGTYEIVVKAFTESSTGAQAGNYLRVSPRGIADMNPAHIIRECLTDPDWGMGYTDNDIDNTSFTSAADTFYDEGLGMSLIWDKQVKIEDFVQTVLRHIDAVLYVSRTTGKFVLKPIRGGYDEGALLSLDESNIISVDDPTRITFGELTNSVTVTYWDATTGKDGSVTVTDTALVQQQGAVINAPLQYPGFSNPRNATIAAQRDLKALSSPLLSCTITADSSAKNLNIGDVFKFSWAKWGLVNVVMRITGISYGTGRNNRVKISCTQDVFDTDASVVVITPGTGGWEDPAKAPTALTYEIAGEAPYYEILQVVGAANVDNQLLTHPEIGYVFAAAGRPASAINANLHTDSGAGYEDTGTFDFAPAGRLAAAIGKLDTSFSIEAFNDLDQVEVGSFFQIDNELMRVDTIDDETGALTVGRGVLDTVPEEHADNAKVIFWDAFAGFDPTEYVDGETVNAKITAATGSGVLPLDDATVLPVDIVGRAARPYAPGDLRINGESYEEDAHYDGEITVTWKHRDRLQQTGGVLLDHTDDNIGPEAETLYRLQIYVGGVLTYTEDDIDGTSTTWNPSVAGTVKAEVHAKRDDLYSYQAPWHEFEVGTNLLLNPSGASGTANWTQTLGTTFTTTTTDPIAGLPQKFVLASNSVKSHVNQTFDVPSINAAAAAAGQLTLNFSFNYNTYNSDSDDAFPRVFFWSGTGGTGTLLGIAYDAPLTSDATVRVDLAYKVPKGTQSISVGFCGKRSAGSELSFYFNGCVANLVAGTHTVVPVYTRDQVDGSGWTVTAGSKTGDTSAEQGDYYLPSQYGGSQASLAYYKDIAASADALALIAGGTAVLRMRSISWNTNGADRSRIYVQCLDASNAVLATCQDAAATTNWGTGPDFNNNTVTIPAGTVTFRIGQQFTRADGTVNDAHTAQISVWVEKAI